MNSKVSDLTVEQLKELISEVVQDKIEDVLKKDMRVMFSDIEL